MLAKSTNGREGGGQLPNLRICPKKKKKMIVAAEGKGRGRENLCLRNQPKRGSWTIAGQNLHRLSVLPGASRFAVAISP